MQELLPPTLVNVDLLRQQIEEVNNYLADNAEPVDLIDQTVEYAIPLSDGSSATTSAIIETLDYKTTGYVGFDVAGVAANLYFTQEIAFVDNCDQNKKSNAELVTQFDEGRLCNWCWRG